MGDRKYGPTVAFIGGGSVNWCPGLIRDILLTECLEGVRFRLLDLNMENAAVVKRFAETMAARWGCQASFEATSDPDEALAGADFIIITISTGGLDAMEHDLVIPERYGIYQTVGDTVGPGGWSRALRNIPVFASYAEKISKIAPDAVVLNYTNPMAVLTQVLAMKTGQSVVGLCHGLFECYAVLQRIFGLSSEMEIRATIAGVNHFFWMLDFSIRGEKGYPLLREKLKGKHFDGLIKEGHVDGAGFGSHKLVAGELLEEFGYLPYVGAGHIAEFFSHYLTSLQNIEKYRLVRTSADSRRRGLEARRQWAERVIAGDEDFKKERSRESAADIIEAVSGGSEFIDVVNLPNRGQVANLPQGVVVETLGVVNGLGFTPMIAGPLPQPLLNLVLPHAANQDAIVRAGLCGDRELALTALANDPLCRHLNYPQIREMGLALMEANKAFLPQFS